MPNAEYRPIDSIRGHRAGNPLFNPDDEAALREVVRDLLSRSPGLPAAPSTNPGRLSWAGRGTTHRRSCRRARERNTTWPGNLTRFRREGVEMPL